MATPFRQSAGDKRQSVLLTIDGPLSCLESGGGRHTAVFDNIATPTMAHTRMPSTRFAENLLFSQWFPIVFAKRQGTFVISLGVVPRIPGHAQHCCGEHAVATSGSSCLQVVQAGDHRSRQTAPAICWQQDFVDFPKVLKVFEEALPRPGALPGGPQGGAFKKPMSFQGF